MKFFQLHKERLNDSKTTAAIIIEFAKENRIPPPWEIKFYEYHADNFIKNEVTVLISSVALMKIP